MNIAQQLYQLQEVDLKLESNEQAQKHISSQLGKNRKVVAAQQKLASEQAGLEELTKKQRSTEWEVNDIVAKLTTGEQKLYSGRIRAPKELASLQQETESLKSRRRQLEDGMLETMGQVEQTTGDIKNLETGLAALKTEWQAQQKQLSADLAELKNESSNLTNKRQQLAAGITADVIEVYQSLKKSRHTAVARVEQGICQGCRISLPASELQPARSGSLRRCGSCGRILFLT